MLGSDEKQSPSDAESLPGYTVGVPDMFLVLVGCQHMLAEPYRALISEEEIIFSHIGNRQGIVVEVNVPVRQTRDPVEEHLDGRTVECREILMGNEIGMEYDIRPLPVNPCRYLTVPGDDQMHLVDERKMLFDPPEKETKEAPVTVALDNG